MHAPRTVDERKHRFIKNDPIPETEGAKSIQIILPQKQTGRKSDIYVSMVSLLFSRFRIHTPSPCTGLIGMDHLSTNGSADCPRHASVLIPRAMRSIDKRMHASVLPQTNPPPQVSSDHQIAPQGKYVAMIQANVETANPKKELEIAKKLVGNFVKEYVTMRVGVVVVVVVVVFLRVGTGANLLHVNGLICLGFCGSFHFWVLLVRVQLLLGV
jgi:hypothetical protein